MSVVIEILNNDIQVIDGISPRTNKAYSIRKQQAAMHVQGEPYPRYCFVSLANGAAPYALGKYTLAPESFYIDRFGNPSLSQHLILRPISAQRAA